MTIVAQIDESIVFCDAVFPQPVRAVSDNRLCIICHDGTPFKLEIRRKMAAALITVFSIRALSTLLHAGTAINERMTDSTSTLILILGMWALMII